MRICLISNLASHYREEIYTLMDSELECDFVFGNTLNNGIKSFDTSGFSNKVTILKNIQKGEVTLWQKGVLKFLFRKYDKYIVSDDIRCWSTWVFIIIARLLNKEVYFWAHGWYGRESWIKALVKKVFYRLPSGSFLYGNYAKDVMVKNGFSEKKLWVIHNSLAYSNQLKTRNLMQKTDVYSSYFKNEAPTIIYIGRLTEYKRLDMLIESLKVLGSRGQYYNLVLVGDGPQREKLQAMTKEYGVGDRVWFYGACYDEARNAELIYNADVCVSPGNIGLTAMHVMVYGTPAITHDCFEWQGPEFEAIKPGKTGDFYKYGSQESMTETIFSWISNQEQCRDEIRRACYAEIDGSWTPAFQLEVIKKHIL